MNNVTDRIDPGRPGADDVPLSSFEEVQQTDTPNSAFALARLMILDENVGRALSQQLVSFEKTLQGIASYEELQAIGSRTLKAIHNLLLQIDTEILQKKSAAGRALAQATSDLEALQAKPIPTATDDIPIDDVMTNRQTALAQAQQRATSCETAVAQACISESEWRSVRSNLLACVAARTHAAIARVAPQVLETAVI